MSSKAQSARSPKLRERVRYDIGPIAEEEGDAAAGEDDGDDDNEEEDERSQNWVDAQTDILRSPAASADGDLRTVVGVNAAGDLAVFPDPAFSPNRCHAASNGFGGLAHTYTLSSQTSSGALSSNNNSHCQHNRSLTLETSCEKSAAEAAAARDERRRRNPPSVLCCSTDEPEDFQVDLCPRAWFNVRDAGDLCHAVWKVLFIVCCLPLCYPCYLTRRCRRKAPRHALEATDEQQHRVYVIKASKVQDGGGGGDASTTTSQNPQRC